MASNAGELVVGKSANDNGVKKAKIVLAFANRQITVSDGAGKAASPIALKINGVVVDGANAVARTLALRGDTGLYPKQPFSDASRAAAAHIDGWIDFGCSTAASISSALQAKSAEAKAAVIKALQGADAWLADKTYLVNNAISLADIILFADVLPAFEQLLEEKDRNSLSNLTRWFDTVAGHPKVSRVVGDIQLCKTAVMGGGSSSKKDVKKEAKRADSSKSKDAKNKPAAKSKDAKVDADGGKDKKKETKLGLVAKKRENFGDWYSQVVVASELISYYEISGCYILRPWAYAMWETVQRWFDAEIKKLGVENAYFPLFITESVLNTEKDHVEGFAPEVAWVTKSGQSELENPIAIRPTSETVMYPYYAQWIRSHRDLPLRLNQWTNVVRWEFKHPTPFIRSREFLWQEGHTAFATREEADKEVLDILDLYRRVYEEIMAVPVIPGRKSSAEKFAGAEYTTTVEAYIPETGRGIQGATSHCLGQNFAKMFNIEYEAEDRQKHHVWQNSWGLTTRTIGVMVMTHADDKGLVLPPRMAPKQVVIIPIPNSKMSDDSKAAMMSKTDELLSKLSDAGVRCTSDTRDNYTPGWKYNHWELKGVPVRMEIGPRDMDSGCVMLVRRDNGVKESVTWDKLLQRVPALLEEMQKDMFNRAKEAFDGCIEQATTWDDFMAALERQHMVLTPWADEEEVEDYVKKNSATPDAMGAKTLCLPFVQPPLPAGAKCFASGKPAKNWALWGRSY